MRFVVVCFLLLSSPALADATLPTPEQAGEPPPTPPVIDPGLGSPGLPKMPESPPAPRAAASVIEAVVRVVCAGRVGGGIVLEGGAIVVTHRKVVAVGWPPTVTSFGGEERRGRIASIDREHDLAVIVLDEPLSGIPAVALQTGIPTTGTALQVIGHGGSVHPGETATAAQTLAAWSRLPSQVVSIPAAEPGAPPAAGYLVSLSPGYGDLGAPVFTEGGALAGLLGPVLDGGAGRTWVVAMPALQSVLATPRDVTRDRRAGHVTTWGGVEIATHNEPFHVGAGLAWGIRAVALDILRFEPFVSLDVGVRWPRTEPTASPWALWTAIEGGLSFGPRIPVFKEGQRDYVVPVVGFRAGALTASWAERRLETVCDGPCALVVREERIRERDLRIGFDLGADLQHGPLRVGYRYFVDPRDPRGRSMHRIVVTLDGFPIPVGTGDGL